MGKKSRPIDLETYTQEQIDEKTQKDEDRNRRQKKILNHQLKLKHIKPLTDNQEKVFHSYFSGQNMLLYGTAGTGKTYIGMYLALNDVLQGNFQHLIIVRSAVSSRDIGFLPGSIGEKLALYEAPYQEMVKDLCQRGDAYDLLKSKKILEFISTSFLRGMTFDDSIIIIDEVQNMTWHEISSILTRVGENTKVIICGDFDQNDLSINGKRGNDSGMDNLVKVIKSMKSFDLCKFEINDIVRSGFVKEFIVASMVLKLNKP